VAPRLTRAVKPSSAPARAPERSRSSPLLEPGRRPECQREDDVEASEHEADRHNVVGHHFGLVDLLAAPAAVAAPGPVPPAPVASRGLAFEAGFTHRAFSVHGFAPTTVGEYLDSPLGGMKVNPPW
jgi:hypothetical protein